MSDLLARLQSSLADRYAVERELGRGGMATVYLARDLKHGRMVALKVLSSDVSVALGAERFHREIEIASSLTHPHILPLYDSGSADGCLFFAMPFVAGESLRTRLDRESQLPLDEAIRITTEVASALDYAHRNGVLHRDVKPANILLEDGHAVIADFGIARAISRAAETDKMTMTGVTLGTPTYMSPEQASGEHALDGRSDIYSLACVLYEMLVGQPPFTGPNAQAVMARHAMETVPSIRVVRATIPEEVEDAILCALSKSPADRPATARQFADALTGGAPTVTRRFTTTRAAARGRKRRLLAQAVLGVFLLLATAGGASAWWLMRGAAGSDDGGDVQLDRSRIAVLYFSDRTRDSALAHLADGLTESLIDQFSLVEGLRVISRRGVDQFRGAVNLASVGTALDVGTIVSGELERLGDSVRVSVQLAEGRSGAVFERTTLVQPLRDVLSARDSVARGVAELLREFLGQEVRLQRERESTDDAEAWSLVQRAARSRRSGEAAARADSGAIAAAHFEAADTLLERAQRLDPHWATPLIARGELARSRLDYESNPLRAGRLLDAGIEHATRALERDARSADARALRGGLRFLKSERGFTTDPVAAGALLRRAQADLDTAVLLAPSHAVAWHALSRLHYRRYDKLAAYNAAQRAYQADAYLESARSILWRLFATAYDLEYWVPAENWCTTGRRRYPSDPLFVRCQLWLLTSKARERPDVEAGWQLARRLDSLAPPAARELLRRESDMLVAAALGRVAQRDSIEGQLDSARVKLDSARRVIARAHVDPARDPHGDLIGIEAAVRIMIGDRDVAIRLLEQYIATNPVHREGFVRNKTWWWDPLRDDARFRALMGVGG